MDGTGGRMHETRGVLDGTGGSMHGPEMAGDPRGVGQTGLSRAELN